MILVAHAYRGESIGRWDLRLRDTIELQLWDPNRVAGVGSVFKLRNPIEKQPLRKT